MTRHPPRHDPARIARFCAIAESCLDIRAAFTTIRAMWMKVLCPIAWLAFAAGSVTAQTKTETRIAGVEINKVFREFHLAKDAVKGFDNERKSIAAGFNSAKFSKLADEVKQADQAVAAAKAANEGLNRALREAELKHEEYRAMDKALREALKKHTDDLNRRLVASTRRLLDEIRKAVEKVGRERGYDIVVDTSGQTNTGIPLILYSRKLPDLTDEVIAWLNKDVPPAAIIVPEPPAAPKNR
jgi:Skp family chaperone for outer membrane proteins